MIYGTLRYPGGVSVEIDRVELKDGKVYFYGVIKKPEHRLYNFGENVQVVAPDGTSILYSSIGPCIIDNRDGHLDGSTILVEQPCAFIDRSKFDWNDYEPLFLEIEAMQFVDEHAAAGAVTEGDTL